MLGLWKHAPLLLRMWKLGQNFRAQLQHTGRLQNSGSALGCLERNACSEAATVNLLKADLLHEWLLLWIRENKQMQHIFIVVKADCIFLHVSVLPCLCCVSALTSWLRYMWMYFFKNPQQHWAEVNQALKINLTNSYIYAKLATSWTDTWAVKCYQ